MAGSKIRLTIAVVLMAAALVVLLARLQEVESDELAVRHSRIERPSALPPVAPVDPARELAHLPPAPRTPTDTVPAESTADATSPREPLVVLGEVLDSTGVGLPGVDVLLRARYDSTDSRSAITGPDGRFELKLDAKEWSFGELANVHVSMGAGQRIFTGVVPLEPDVSILLAPSVFLSGLLVDAERLDLEDVAMRFDVPAGTRFKSNLFIGKTPLAKDGRFSLNARLPTTTDVVLMTFFHGTRPLGNAAASIDVLTSTDGATISLDVARLALRFEDVDGRALPDVQVSASPAGRNFGLAPVPAVSDEDGHVDFLLGRGAVEVCAHRDGFVAQTWTATLSAAAHAGRQTVVLEKRVEPQMISGVVLKPDGTPLSGTAVSVFPKMETDAGFMARSKVATDEDGRFSLELLGDGLHRIWTVHRKYGRGPKVVVSPGTGEVTIWFEQRGGLLLDVVTASNAIHSTPGPLECVLVDRRRDFVISEHIWGTPSPLSGIPTGSYNLYVHWPGMDVSGAVAVEVAAGEQAECRVVLEPTRWLDGFVVDQDGRPIARASVERVSAIERLGHSHPWRKAVTADDGRFRIRLGRSLGPHELKVTGPSGSTASWSGMTGPAHVEVDVH